MEDNDRSKTLKKFDDGELEELLNENLIQKRIGKKIGITRQCSSSLLEFFIFNIIIEVLFFHKVNKIMQYKYNKQFDYN